MSADDAATFASVLKDAIDYYFAKSDKSSLLAGEEHLSALIAALSEGITEGIALHSRH